MTALRRAAPGFTLLEVMIAIAILSIALVAVLDGQGSAMVAARKARALEITTLLAREKMEELAMKVEREGFTDENETDCEEGTFGDRGREDLRWKACVVKVKLNLNVTDVGALASSLFGGGGGEGEEGDPAAGAGDTLAALGLDPMTLTFALELLPTITESLAQAIRRLELTVTWDELGLGEQSFRLVLYVTDPTRAELNLGMAGPMPPGMAGPGMGMGTGPGAPLPIPGAGAMGGGAGTARPLGPGTGARP